MSESGTAARAFVALATAAELPDGDEDAAAVQVALGALDVESVSAVWDDPAVDWGAFDLVIVRSTWDYAPRHEAFLHWADDVSARTRLANTAAVIRWNTDKRYLLDLIQAGVPTVETTWSAPGEHIRLPGEKEVVVKPAVSAGAIDTARYAVTDFPAIERHVGRLHARGKVAMIQPYLPAVDVAGETSLIYLGGVFSHAIRKGPLLSLGAPPVEGLYAEEDITPRIAEPAELAMAEAALALVPGDPAELLYARVDCLPGPDGESVVIEVELTEPSLFLAHADGAAERFAAAIVARL